MKFNKMMDLLISFMNLAIGYLVEYIRTESKKQTVLQVSLVVLWIKIVACQTKSDQKVNIWNVIEHELCFLDSLAVAFKEICKGLPRKANSFSPCLTLYTYSQNT